MISKNEFRIKVLNRLWVICSKRNEYDKWICGFIKTIDRRLTPSVVSEFDYRALMWRWVLTIKFKKLTAKATIADPVKNKTDAQVAAKAIIKYGLQQIQQEIEDDKIEKLEKKQYSHKNKNKHLPKGVPEQRKQNGWSTTWSAGKPW